MSKIEAVSRGANLSADLFVIELREEYTILAGEFPVFHAAKHTSTIFYSFFALLVRAVGRCPKDIVRVNIRISCCIVGHDEISVGLRKELL
jgi:hypothetical protein